MPPPPVRREIAPSGRVVELEVMACRVVEVERRAPPWLVLISLGVCPDPAQYWTLWALMSLKSPVEHIVRDEQRVVLCRGTRLPGSA